MRENLERKFEIDNIKNIPNEYLLNQGTELKIVQQNNSWFCTDESISVKYSADKNIYLLSNKDTDKRVLKGCVGLFPDGKLLPVIGRDQLVESLINIKRDFTSISRTQLVIIKDPQTGEYNCTQDFAKTSNLFTINRVKGGFKISNSRILKVDLFISNQGGISEFDPNFDQIKIGRADLISHLNKYYSDKPLIHELISNELVYIENGENFKTLIIKITPFFKFTDENGKLLEEFESKHVFKIGKHLYLKVILPDDTKSVLVGNAKGATLLADVLRLNLETAELSVERDNIYHFFPEEVQEFYEQLEETCIAKIETGADGSKIPTKISIQDLSFPIENTCFEYTGSNQKVKWSNSPVYKAELKKLIEQGVSVYIPKISPNGYVDYVKLEESSLGVRVLPPGTKLIIKNREEEYLVVGEKFPSDPFFEINNIFKEVFDIFKLEYKFNPKEILSILMDLEGISEQDLVILATTNDLSNSKGASNEEVSNTATIMTDKLVDQFETVSEETVEGNFGGDGCTISATVKFGYVTGLVQDFAQSDIETTQGTQFNIRTGAVVFNYNKFINHLLGSSTGIDVLKSDKINQVVFFLMKASEIFSDYLQTTGKESDIKGNIITTNTELAEKLELSKLNGHSFSANGVTPGIKEPVKTIVQQGGYQTAIFERYETGVTTFSSEQIGGQRLRLRKRLRDLKTNS